MDNTMCKHNNPSVSDSRRSLWKTLMVQPLAKKVQSAFFILAYPQSCCLGGYGRRYPFIFECSIRCTEAFPPRAHPFVDMFDTPNGAILLAFQQSFDRLQMWHDMGQDGNTFIKLIPCRQQQFLEDLIISMVARRKIQRHCSNIAWQ